MATPGSARRLVAGQERSIPAPSEAAQSTKASGDLLRRFKELRESLRNEYSEPPSLSQSEVDLRVRPRWPLSMGRLLDAERAGQS